MSTRTKLEVARNGIRWARNILTEIAGNNVGVLPEEAAEKLSEVCSLLAMIDNPIATAIRDEDQAALSVLKQARSTPRRHS